MRNRRASSDYWSYQSTSSEAKGSSKDIFNRITAESPEVSGFPTSTVLKKHLQRIASTLSEQDLANAPFESSLQIAAQFVKSVPGIVYCSEGDLESRELSATRLENVVRVLQEEKAKIISSFPLDNIGVEGQWIVFNRGSADSFDISFFLSPKLNSYPSIFAALMKTMPPHIAFQLRCFEPEESGDCYFPVATIVFSVRSEHFTEGLKVVQIVRNEFSDCFSGRSAPESGVLALCDGISAAQVEAKDPSISKRVQHGFVQRAFLRSSLGFTKELLHGQPQWFDPMRSRPGLMLLGAFEALASSSFDSVFPTFCEESLVGVPEKIAAERAFARASMRAALEIVISHDLVTAEIFSEWFNEEISKEGVFTSSVSADSIRDRHEIRKVVFTGLQVAALANKIYEALEQGVAQESVGEELINLLRHSPTPNIELLRANYGRAMRLIAPNRLINGRRNFDGLENKSTFALRLARYTISQMLYAVELGAGNNFDEPTLWSYLQTVNAALSRRNEHILSDEDIELRRQAYRRVMDRLSPDRFPNGGRSFEQLPEAPLSLCSAGYLAIQKLVKAIDAGYETGYYKEVLSGYQNRLGKILML